MPTLSSAIAALERIDWDFPQAGTRRSSVHTIHWFPGNYISQIPSFLIQILSTPGDVVCDPFVGSGTTAVEANLLGRNAIVSDCLSPCTRLTLAKIQMISTTNAKHYFGEILNTIWWDGNCTTEEHGQRGEGSAPSLREWYAPKTLAELRYLWRLVEDAPQQYRHILLAIFSDTLFTCASTLRSRTSSGRTRRHHWGWVADNVVPKPPIGHNAIDHFRLKLRAASDLVVPASVEPVGTLILQQDARRMALSSKSVDLVVTSPPYIGVIDYAKANRLLYLWMGWHLGEERVAEIGARYKRTRKNFRAEYESAMDGCWQEIIRVLRSGGYCAIIIGESHKFEGTVTEMISRWSRSMPLVWGPVRRTPQRRRVSDRGARLPIEYVCVFRKK